MFNFLFTELKAQENEIKPFEDVLILKDKTELKGYIMRITEDSVYIKTTDALDIGLAKNEIEQTIKDNRANNLLPKYLRPYKNKISGFSHQFITSTLCGRGNYGLVEPGFSIQYTLQYYLQPEWIIGTGYTVTQYINEGVSTFYLRGRYNYRFKNHEPYFSLDIGGGLIHKSLFDNRKNNTLGFYYEPTIAWKFRTQRKVHWVLSLGTRVQHLNYDEDSWQAINGRATIKKTFIRTNFGFGIEF